MERERAREKKLRRQAGLCLLARARVCVCCTHVCVLENFILSLHVHSHTHPRTLNNMNTRALNDLISDLPDIKLGHGLLCYHGNRVKCLAVIR